jgi:hypothetical protein
VFSVIKYQGLMLTTLRRTSDIFSAPSCPAIERKIPPLAVNNFAGLA